MANREGFSQRFDSAHSPASKLQLIFDLPHPAKWIRLCIHLTSPMGGMQKTILKTSDGRELLAQVWSGTWRDELFLPVPAGTTHLAMDGSADVEVIECRLQPVSRLHMGLIALRSKWKLLTDYGCTGKALKRGFGLILRGRFGEFRRKVMRGVDDSRFIAVDDAKTEFDADCIAPPRWLESSDIEPTMEGRRFVLLTPSLTAGDAVSNDVVGMAHSLRAAGAEVFICSRFASKVWPVVPINQLAGLLRPRDVLIYHHSIGFAEAERLFDKLDCLKILKYHNITPPKLLKTHSPDLAKACEQGLGELPRLLNRAQGVFVDSEFNAEALPAEISYGVVPPFNQIDELLRSPADDGKIDRVGILMVGRVAPNKNIEMAVEALAVLRRNHRPDAKLTVAGAISSWEYIHSLQVLAEKLDVRDDVQFVGAVSLAKLKGLYRRADALLSTSLHEGFGLPLLEAMALKVPVVAVPRGAVSATLDGCGWICPEMPSDLARTLVRAIEPSDERSIKLLLGERHYRNMYTNAAICERFLERVEQVTRPIADPLLHLSHSREGYLDSNFTSV